MLTIATMHRKEEVMQSIMEQVLGVKCLVPLQIDTDSLGTFSGETERKNDPLTTLRLKCEMGSQLTGSDLVIASEGSFGQHPYLFFSKANEEMVLLQDRLHNFEISGSYLTTETNYDSQEVTCIAQVMEFAERNLFPSHGMILKLSAESKTCIQKGITDLRVLKDFAERFLKQNGSIQIETDMRALYNPTRMSVIRKATENLIQKITSLCPQCSYPGFWIFEAMSGLPCSQCGLKTQSTYSHHYKCIQCKYREERKFPNGKQMEDPMYCDFCNP